MVERVRSNRRVRPASQRQQRDCSIVAERAKFFGPAPLLAGEDAAHHTEFLQQVTAAVQPIDIIEEIWARDFVYHESDASLLRQLKAKRINDAARDLLEHEILGCSEKETEDAAELPAENDCDAILEQAANELARRWIAGDQGAKNEMQKIFAAAGRNLEEVLADVMETAIINTIQDAEWIDRRIMTEEARRNAVVRELDRHRAMLSLQFRRTPERVHDADYKVIEDQKGQS
jgi:hypothetical protein